MSATQFFERPYELVHDQIGQMTVVAQQALAQAQTAVTALTNIPSPTGVDPPPRFNQTTPPAAPVVLPIDPIRPTYGSLQPITIPALDNGQSLVTDLENPDAIPSYVPPFTALTIPAPPAPIDTTSGLPAAPVFVDVTLPPTPLLPSVELGNLVDIVIPTFAGLTLPTFDAVAPAWTMDLPSTVVGWSEPTYTSELRADLYARIKTMLAGGTGLTPEIEQALFDRTRVRVDREGEKNVQEAFDTFAARNFDMPPGMLVANVNAARENAQLQNNATARDILVQAAQWEIENLRQAVTQGIAGEAQIASLFNAMADRGFQAAKYRVEADISLYNANATVFNALNSAYKTKADVYAELIRGELAKLEAFKAQIEAEQAKGQVNEQTIKVYTARLDAIKNVIALYTAQLEGAKAVTDQNRARADVYKASIDGFSARMGAEKTRFDAYKTQVDGEAAKAQLLESSARAFAATVTAYETRGNLKIANVRARIEAQGAATQRFVAQVQAERDQAVSQAEIVRAQVATFQADIQLLTGKLDFISKDKQVQLSLVEANLRNALAYYEIQVKEYDQALARILEEMKVRVEGLKTVAQTTSQIAAGAFAAMHVSAQMSGEARASDSYSREDRYEYVVDQG